MASDFCEFSCYPNLEPLRSDRLVSTIMRCIDFIYLCIKTIHHMPMMLPFLLVQSPFLGKKKTKKNHQHRPRIKWHKSQRPKTVSRASARTAMRADNSCKNLS